MTKYIAHSIVVLLLLMTASLQAQDAFEGTIKSTYIAKEQKADFTWLIKGNKIAMEMDFGHKGKLFKSRYIIDQETGIVDILTETIEGNFHHQVKTEQIQGNPQFQMSNLKISPTEEYDDILEMKTQKHLVSSDGLEAESWIATEIQVNFESFQTAFKGDPILKALADTGMQGFPMLSIVKDKEGRNLYTHTVNYIRPGKVSRKEFSVPAGYQSQE